MSKYIQPEGHWQPWYDDRRDYNTNAPTYYDYLANMNGVIQQLTDYVNKVVSRDVEVEDTSSIDMVKEASWLTSELNKTIIKANAKISQEGDNGNLIEIKDDGLFVDGKLKKDLETLTSNFEKFKQKVIVGGSGINVNTLGDITTISADLTKLQGKLVAGDNIEIKGNVIKAVRDASAADKEPKIKTLIDATRAAGTFQTLPPEGFVFEDVRLNEMRTQGTYYVSASTSLTGGGAWVIVHSTKNHGACLQIVVREYGGGVYWRTGTPAKKKSSEGKVDGYWTEWRTFNMRSPLTGELLDGGVSKVTQENINKTTGWSDDGLISPDGQSERLFYRYSDNTVKKQRFLFRNWKKDDHFQSFAIKPRSRTMYKFSEQENIDGTMRNLVQIYDWQEGRRIRSYYTKSSIGHANDAAWVGDDIYIASSGAGVYRFRPDEHMNEDSIVYTRCPFIPNDVVGTGTRRVSGITSDPDNEKILYITTNDETPNKIAASDRVIIWKWNLDDNTYVKMYDAPRTRWYVQGMEYYKGKFYVAYSKTNETTNHVGIEIDVIDKSSQEVVETFTMSGLIEPEGMHLLDAPVQDAHGTLTRWDAYLCVGISEYTAEQAFTAIAPEPSTEGIDRYGDNW